MLQGVLGSDLGKERPLELPLCTGGVNAPNGMGPPVPDVDVFNRSRGGNVRVGVGRGVAAKLVDDEGDMER